MHNINELLLLVVLFIYNIVIIILRVCVILLTRWFRSGKLLFYYVGNLIFCFHVPVLIVKMKICYIWVVSCLLLDTVPTLYRASIYI